MLTFLINFYCRKPDHLTHIAEYNRQLITIIMPNIDTFTGTRT